MALNLTSQRKTILSIISDSDIPLCAKDIFAGIKDKMDQSTLYRSLQYLENHHIIEGFTLNCEENGINRYYVEVKDKHNHFFHCTECHKFLPVDQCIDRTIDELEKAYEFKIRYHILYFVGVCRECNAINS